MQRAWAPKRSRGGHQSQELAVAGIKGTPLDTGSITGLIQTAFEALIAFIAAHGSYSLLTGRTAPQPQG
jgi:hypothetical protein